MCLWLCLVYFAWTSMILFVYLFMICFIVSGSHLRFVCLFVLCLLLLMTDTQEKSNEQTIVSTINLLLVVVVAVDFNFS